MNKFIPVAIPDFSGNEKKYVNDCVSSTWISSNGKYIKEFERSFAAFNNTKEAVACCSGTAALHIALLAMGIKAGDEVIIPSFTYIATANAVKYCGAKPVFADCLADTWNINPNDAKRRVTKNTKCIIPVHLYGNPCDMDSVMAIADEHGLYVLEDAAECHGAFYRGRKTGSIGNVGVFSFFGNKIITTGEGGMIITDDKEMADKMRLLKGQGMDPDRRYWFSMVGYNYRMTNIEAAIGLAQLEHIDEHIEKRKLAARRYFEEFKRLEGYVSFQRETPGANSAWWMFSILLNDEAKISRDNLIIKLREDGIETRPLFYPMHIMPPYLDDKADCPVSEDISAHGLNLPTHGLLTQEDICYIVSRIKAYII